MRIGIDLGGTKIEGILLDNLGVEKARLKVATPTGDYLATIQAITNLVADIEKLGNLRNNETPIGIGIPGTVSPATSLIKNASWAHFNASFINSKEKLGLFMGCFLEAKF